MVDQRKLQRLADGVHRFADGVVNWYVIEGSDGLVLVDAGWPRSWSRVRSVVHALGHDVTAITAVALTHGHPDHQGAAADARQAGAAVHAHRDEAPYLRGEAPRSTPFAMVPALLPHVWRPAAIRFVVHAVRHGFLTPTWLDEVSVFEDGARLQEAAGLRAVHTPGHTRGHTAYVLEDRGVVFSGDALVTVDVLTGATGAQLLPDALHADPAGARESLHRFADLDGEVLAPGHGEPATGRVADLASEAARRTSARAN